MCCKGHHSHSLGASPHELVPWAPGVSGKFLIDVRGKFYSWRTDELAPHHAIAAEQLGVTSWVLDGIVNPDGTLEPTAVVPGTSPSALLTEVAPQFEPLGMRRRLA